VLAASAETGAGLIELVGAIDERYAELLASGEIAARRARADARALSQFV